MLANGKYWTRVLSHDDDGFGLIKGTENPWEHDSHALVWAGAYMATAADKSEIVECICPAGHTVWIVEWIEGQEFPVHYSEMRDEGGSDF